MRLLIATLFLYGTVSVSQAEFGMFQTFNNGVWILTTGLWNDSGVWLDGAAWID